MEESKDNNLTPDQKAALAQVDSVLSGAKSGAKTQNHRRKIITLIIVVAVLSVGLLIATILINTKLGQ